MCFLANIILQTFEKSLELLFAMIFSQYQHLDPRKIVVSGALFRRPCQNSRTNSKIFRAYPYSFVFTADINCFYHSVCKSTS